ncbi:MAG: hypothetical protein ISP91_06465 [Pseudomonadales bacterium]|nr:hypothetical protein [Pseudomonadales bacterium]
MTLDEIASIGELLSGIGVILSLIFVGFQIRQNSVLLRRAANREAVTALGDAFRPAIEDAELAEILNRFQESYKNLNAVEQHRASLYQMVWIQQFELINADYKIGNYDEEPYEYFARAVAASCSTPGGKEWWQENRHILTPSAQKAIQDAIDKWGST